MLALAMHSANGLYDAEVNMELSVLGLDSSGQKFLVSTQGIHGHFANSVSPDSEMIINAATIVGDDTSASGSPAAPDPTDDTLNDTMATLSKRTITSPYSVPNHVTLAPTASPQLVPPFCTYGSWTRIAAPTSTWMTVGEAPAYLDTKILFSYNAGADTTIGIAYSYDGTNWSISGSASVNTSSEFGGTSPWQSNMGAQEQTTFNVVKNRRPLVCQDGSIRGYQYSIVPGAAAGGFRNGPSQSSWDGPSGNGQGCSYQGSLDCKPYIGGSTAYRASGTGYKYGAGVSAFGVTLSGETNFTSHTRLDWSFPSTHKTYYLFGHHSPPSTATIIYSSRSA